MEIEQYSTESPLSQGRNKEGNGCTTCQNLWDTIKAVLSGKFVTLGAYIKKVRKSHTSDLKAHLKTLEQKESNSPKRSR